MAAQAENSKGHVGSKTTKNALESAADQMLRKLRKP
jgi:hypothetical protein